MWSQEKSSFGECPIRPPSEEQSWCYLLPSCCRFWYQLVSMVTVTFTVSLSVKLDFKQDFRQSILTSLRVYHCLVPDLNFDGSIQLRFSFSPRKAQEECISALLLIWEFAWTSVFGSSLFSSTISFCFTSVPVGASLERLNQVFPAHSPSFVITVFSFRMPMSLSFYS